MDKIQDKTFEIFYNENSVIKCCLCSCLSLDSRPTRILFNLLYKCSYTCKLINPLEVLGNSNSFQHCVYVPERLSSHGVHAEYKPVCPVQNPLKYALAGSFEILKTEGSVSYKVAIDLGLQYFVLGQSCHCHYCGTDSS